MEHQAIFMYKLLYNHFCCSIPVSFNCDFHDYYTRSRNDIRKSSATRCWGHWSSVNFSSNVWNRVDTSLREAETQSPFKCGLSKAILWYVYVHLYVLTALLTNMWIVKFKSQLTIAFFAAVNNLGGPLRKQNFTLTGSKGHGFWFVIGGFRSVLCVSVFQGSLLVIVIMINGSEKRNCERGLIWNLEFACLWKAQ